MAILRMPTIFAPLRIPPPPLSTTTTTTTMRLSKPQHCSATPQQLQQQADEGLLASLCEPCNGKGWLVCDFCKGQKTNVKSETNRIYRRCPSCRAIGCVLCSSCKVFKCVTFPNFNDGEEISF